MFGGDKTTGSLDGGGYDRDDPVVADKCPTVRLFEDEDELHWPLCRGEGGRCVVGLSMCRYKAHVSGQDVHASRHVSVASNGNVV